VIIFLGKSRLNYIQFVGVVASFIDSDYAMIYVNSLSSPFWTLWYRIMRV